jgi:hypothetical protein
MMVAPLAAAAARYEGRVIDAETKLPLAGAVVVVIWMKQPAISIDAVESFQAARETLTDADGRFALDATPPKTWNHSGRYAISRTSSCSRRAMGAFRWPMASAAPNGSSPAPRTSTNSSSPGSRSPSSCLD